jgi:hypothetical protein
MLHCRDFEEALWEAAEGRPLSAEAEVHLQACASCRAAAQRLAEASQGFAALRAVDAPSPGAAVWGRVARPKRRPVFALAWAAGAVACAVATTFALRHQPTPVVVPPAEHVAQAPAGPLAGPQAEVPAPEHQPVATGEIAPVKVSAGAQKTTVGGAERLVSRSPKTRVTQRREEPQPQAPPQAQVAEGETTVVQAAADGSCSPAAALAYRAIGRGLVARLFSSSSETGEIEHPV